mmetsp:Transcript_37866/g.100824  ORF Transcript_37866/g.100824 Transcript_37866/m.100824 type:complete len:214 (+) Transcript_37866:681-1322(+)
MGPPTTKEKARVHHFLQAKASMTREKAKAHHFPARDLLFQRERWDRTKVATEKAHHHQKRKARARARVPRLAAKVRQDEAKARAARGPRTLWRQTLQKLPRCTVCRRRNSVMPKVRSSQLLAQLGRSTSKHLSLRRSLRLGSAGSLHQSEPENPAKVLEKRRSKSSILQSPSEYQWPRTAWTLKPLQKLLLPWTSTRVCSKKNLTVQTFFARC